MNCPNCGAPMGDQDRFCPQCGAANQAAGTSFKTASAEVHETSVPQGNSNWQQNTDGTWENAGTTRRPGGFGSGMPQNDPTLDYTPLSMWVYLGYQILFSIPCVGFIFLLVFSLGGTKNINLRNFARSYFCFLLVLIVFSLLLGSCGLVGTALSSYT